MSESKPKTGRRAPSTAFKPGQSGNPGGRPKKTDEERSLETLCREKTPEAMGTILALMNTGQERTRLAAAQFIIERGWGKAAQTIDVTTPVEVHSTIEFIDPNMPAEEAARIYNRILKGK